MKHLQLEVHPSQVAVGKSMGVFNPIIDGTMGVGVYNSQVLGKVHRKLGSRSDLCELEILMLLL